MYFDFNDIFIFRYYTNRNNVTDINSSLFILTRLGASIGTTTASTSTSTGALVVSGGVGIAGSLNAGGTVTGVHLSTPGKIFLGPTYDGFNNVITATSTFMELTGPGAYPNRTINFNDNVYINNKLTVAGVTFIGSSPDGIKNRIFLHTYGLEIVGSGGSSNLSSSDRIIALWDKVGINRTDPTYNLDVNGTARANSFFGTSNTSCLTFSNFATSNATTSHIFPATGAPLVINGMSFGTGDAATSTIFNLCIASWYGIGFLDSSTKAVRIYMDLRSGIIYATNYSNTSDYRIKENVVDLKETDYTVDKIRPVQYFNKQTQKEDIGFIAHELQETYPFLVTGEKDGKEMQTVNYIGLIPILTKEIQTLKSIVKEQGDVIKEQGDVIKELKELLKEHIFPTTCREPTPPL
jgi:hypothetical protein